MEGEVGEGERRLVEAGERGRSPAAPAPAAPASAAAATAFVSVGGVVAPILAAAGIRNKGSRRVL